MMLKNTKIIKMLLKMFYCITDEAMNIIIEDNYQRMLRSI